MSRIWKLPITLPAWVTACVDKKNINVTWPKWKLSYNFVDDVSININDSTINVVLVNKNAVSHWGTTRSIVANLVTWVSQWYTKSLEINGVWYKFEIQNNKLLLSVGYSHKVEKDIPQDLQVVIDEKAKNVIHVSGIDKQKVGQFAAQVKMIKKPEPYKWKGIKYRGEKIRRKAGKTGKK